MRPQDCPGECEAPRWRAIELAAGALLIVDAAVLPDDLRQQLMVAAIKMLREAIAAGPRGSGT